MKTRRENKLKLTLPSEAYVIDIINTCSHLDKYDSLPIIAISDLTLNAIPQSHPEELDNITLADRLNRLEPRMSCIQITLDSLIAENLTLKHKVYYRTSYTSKISSGIVNIGVTTASHGVTIHSQSTGKKLAKMCIQSLSQLLI